MKIYKRFQQKNQITLYKGDCLKLLKQIPGESVDLVITSPPYCMGKEYEDPHNDIQSFQNEHKRIFSDIYRVLKIGGSLCWQVGYHINEATVFPLDFYVYNIFMEESKKLDVPLLLRNRIIWTFGHGLNSTQRFSGRHETILWFTKGDKYSFDLDSIRVPQKYPGKRSYKGPNKGNLSGNALGKNPSDVWDIPNVKSRHIEKTEHPCQFPIALAGRLIKALTPEDGLVLDPYAGVGTSGASAVLEGRKFVGAEIFPRYYDIAIERIKAALSGELCIRDDVPVVEPDLNSSVAKLPIEFAEARGLIFDGDKKTKAN